MKNIALLFVLFALLFAPGKQVSGKTPGFRPLNGIHSAVSDNDSDLSINNLSVYPNPVFETVKIAFLSSKKSIAAIRVFNNIGNKVYATETEVNSGLNGISIDVRKNAFNPGIYFVQIAIENEVYTRKLIVK